MQKSTYAKNAHGTEKLILDNQILQKQKDSTEKEQQLKKKKKKQNKKRTHMKITRP